MERNKAWRREKQRIKVIKRLKSYTNQYSTYYLFTCEHNKSWTDFIGSHESHRMKTAGSPYYDTDKERWGKKGSKKNFYWNSSFKSRRWDKKRFQKELEQMYFDGDI